MDARFSRMVQSRELQGFGKVGRENSDLPHGKRLVASVPRKTGGFLSGLRRGWRIRPCLQSCSGHSSTMTAADGFRPDLVGVPTEPNRGALLPFLDVNAADSFCRRKAARLLAVSGPAAGQQMRCDRPTVKLFCPLLEISSCRACVQHSATACRLACQGRWLFVARQMPVETSLKLPPFCTLQEFKHRKPLAVRLPHCRFNVLVLLTQSLSALFHALQSLIWFLGEAR